MKIYENIKNFIYNLPERKWLYRISLVVFYVLLTSFLLNMILAFLVFDPTVGCSAGYDKIVYCVYCKGFPFAEIVETVLGIHILLWQLLLMLIFLLIDGSFVQFFTEGLMSGDFVVIVWVLGIPIGTLILNGFAILYLLHILTRGWRRIKRR